MRFSFNGGVSRVRSRVRAFAVTLTIAAAACAPEPAHNHLAAGDPQVRLLMREYQFDYEPFRAGRTVVRVHNAGELPHDLVVLGLKEGSPPLEEQIKGQSAFTTLFAMPERQPGKDGMFAIDLPPGRYGFLCLVQDSDGVSHYKKGMASEITVA